MTENGHLQRIGIPHKDTLIALRHTQQLVCLNVI